MPVVAAPVTLTAQAAAEAPGSKTWLGRRQGPGGTI
jgi:hypothetical protein